MKPFLRVKISKKSRLPSGDQLEVTGKGIILGGEIIEVKTDNDEEILN